MAVWIKWWCRSVWIWWRLSIGVELVEMVMVVCRRGFGGRSGGVDLGEVVVDRCGLVEVFQFLFYFLLISLLLIWDGDVDLGCGVVDLRW